jgi:hypothetical protein
MDIGRRNINRRKVLLCALAAAPFVWAVWPRRHSGDAKPLAAIRGDLIAPLTPPTQTLSLATSTAPEMPPPKKKFPKPASFQRRMVEFHVRQPGATDTGEAHTFGGNPSKVIFGPAQLAALPETPLPAGYQRIGFDTLSAFPFEVTEEMANGSNDAAAASAATRARIPADVLALDHHQVSIRGFLLPLKMNNGLAFEFLLMRNQNMCCFGSVPKVNEWVAVRTSDAGVKPLLDQPLTVLGNLRVGDLRENGYLVGIYQLDAVKVIWQK